MTEQDKTTGIHLAVQWAGSQQGLAQLLRGRGGKPVSQQAVSQWLAQGYAPLKRAHEIAALPGCPAGALDLAPPDVRELVANSQTTSSAA